MERRDFLKSAGVAAATATLAGASSPSSARGLGPRRVPGPRPNILFILVDELRFPSVFPTGVNNVGEFLQRFMPNVHSLWTRGVKFGRHYTAASACTPSRGVLITGLYSQQSWLMLTLTNDPGQRALTPPLNPAYPTYGKLLRSAGYRTPYIGKWHVSFDLGAGLEPYGFEGLISPDPVGFNLQGTVGQEPDFPNDQDIADQAVQWLSDRRPDEGPWCATVSFVNPHDQEFFWAGTEFQTYNNLFPAGELEPVKEYSTPDDPPLVSWDDNPLKTVPFHGFPPLPPNWQSTAALQANKPSTQVLAQLGSAAIFSGLASEDPSQTGFTVQPYPAETSPPIGVAVAPYSYWQRCLDSYANIMSIVDQRIGEVLSALPSDVAQNTIIVFASDHGEYAGAHGIMSGKLLTCYEEAYHVPLIVVDPSHRFVGDIDTVRTGLTSSVDFLPLLVSLGHNGSRKWMTGQLARIYSRRHNMIRMLRSARAPGRRHLLLATDELLPAKFNFNNAPLHIVGLRTESAKLATYSTWTPRTGKIEPETMELEFYDYGTPEGAAEMVSDPDDRRARVMLNMLLKNFIPNELRERLPGALGAAQELSKGAYLFVEEQVLDPNSSGSVRGLLRSLGYGREF
jgi:arylsulfatase A-like enzyme